MHADRPTRVAQRGKIRQSFTKVRMHGSQNGDQMVTNCLESGQMPTAINLDQPANYLSESVSSDTNQGSIRINNGLKGMVDKELTTAQPLNQPGGLGGSMASAAYECVVSLAE